MREAYQSLSIEERRAWVAQRDPEKVKASDHRRYRKKHPQPVWMSDAERIAARDASAKRTRAKYPIQYKARTAVNNALRDGRLIRQPCEACGAEEGQAHHDDYSKPLEVRWLCGQHHRAAHGR